MLLNIVENKPLLWFVSRRFSKVGQSGFVLPLPWWTTRKRGIHWRSLLPANTKGTGDDSRSAMLSRVWLYCARPQGLQYQYQHTSTEPGGTALQLAKSWETSLVLSAITNKKCEASPLLAGISWRFGSTEFSKERNGSRKKLIQIFDNRNNLVCQIDYPFVSHSPVLKEVAEKWFHKMIWRGTCFRYLRMPEEKNKSHHGV